MQNYCVRLARRKVGTMTTQKGVDKTQRDLNPRSQPTLKNVSGDTTSKTGSPALHCNVTRIKVT